MKKNSYSAMAKTIRFSLIQMGVVGDKQRNLDRAAEMIRETVAKDKPHVVVLPECFNSPYSTKHFAENAETIPDGPTSQRLSAIAKESNVYFIGGSYPERDAVANTIHNTCTIWSPTGDFLGKYRKMHLFDMDLKANEFRPGFCFKESDVFTAGDALAILDVDGFKIGIGICADIGSPELAIIYLQHGVDMLVYPSAFERTTGSMAWELFFRARAADFKVFFVAVSPSWIPNAEYEAYGHTMMVNPWGHIVKEAGDGEEVVVYDVDPEVVRQAREQVPKWEKRRLDLYDVVSKFKTEPTIIR